MIALVVCSRESLTAMSVISSDGAYRKINGKWLIAPEHVSIYVDLVRVKLFTNEAIAVRIVPQSRARKNNKRLAQAPSAKQHNSFTVRLSTLSAQRAGLKNEMIASGDSRWYSERVGRGQKEIDLLVAHVFVRGPRPLFEGFH
jgi:hypothetical protein